MATVVFRGAAAAGVGEPPFGDIHIFVECEEMCLSRDGGGDGDGDGDGVDGGRDGGGEGEGVTAVAAAAIARREREEEWRIRGAK